MEAVARPLELAAVADLSGRYVDSGQGGYVTDPIARHQSRQKNLHREVGETGGLFSGLSIQ
jgi:hypothetical protein